MKTRRITLVSISLAVALVVGTVTVFATSAKDEEPNSTALVNAEAVESGAEMKPNAEYISAGITEQKNQWYYQQKIIAALYDDNGGIYMNSEAENGFI